MLKQLPRFNSQYLQILKYILILFFGWRIIISLIAFFGLSFLPFHSTPSDLGWSGSDTEFWFRWANWDGGHFRAIADTGYLDFQVVFFPLYPLLIKFLMLFGFSSLWSGLIVSNLCIIFALFVFYKIILLDYDDNTARKAILLLLAFPTAFYFGATYSESLFLLLVIASFYFARRKYWFISLILAGLASVTRLAGLAVIAAVALEYYLRTISPPTIKELWKSSLIRYVLLTVSIIFIGTLTEKFLYDDYLYLYLGVFSTVSPILVSIVILLLFLYSIKFLLGKLVLKKIFTIQTTFFVLALLPFLIYCSFLYFTQDSFFAFLKYEGLWSRHLDLPWNAPIFYLKRLIAVRIFQLGSPAHTLLEFIFFLFFSVLLVFSYLKLRISYTFFFACCLLLPASSGTLVSIHRYGLVIFPIFILLARIKDPEISNLWLFFSLMLQGLLLVLFFNSYWVT